MRTVSATSRISRGELQRMADSGFGDLVKAVVDVAQSVMVVDADLHADQEAALLVDGSRQGDLWGINLYPGMEGEDFVEFDSMINLRPSRGNRSRSVEDPGVRERIRRVVTDLVTP